MKKIYEFNPEGFRNALERKRLKMVDVQRMFGYVNNAQIKKWADGADIYMGKACEFCSEFGLDIEETFLLVNGKVPDKGKDGCSDYESDTDSRGKPYQLQEIFDLIEQARDKERAIYEETLRKERERFENKLKEMGAAYEKMVTEKNNEILEERKKYGDAVLKNREMQMRLEELTRQYQELELKNKSFVPLGCAENTTYLKK